MKSSSCPWLKCCLSWSATACSSTKTSLPAKATNWAPNWCGLEQQAYEIAGQPFNLNSPKQLQEILLRQNGHSHQRPEKNRFRRRVHQRSRAPSSSRPTTPCPASFCETAASPSSNPPTPTSYLKWSDPPPAACTPLMPKPWPSPAGSPATTPTSKTVPIRTAEGRRVRRAFVAPAGQHNRIAPTIRKSNCASWRT